MLWEPSYDPTVVNSLTSEAVNAINVGSDGNVGIYTSMSLGHIDITCNKNVDSSSSGRITDTTDNTNINANDNNNANILSIILIT